MSNDLARNNVDDFDYKLFFHNPQCLSLEKVYLNIKVGCDDEKQTVKALDKFWVKEQYYSHFPPLPQKNNVEENKKWLEHAEQYIISLKFILYKLPFYKFWSNILYDPKLMKMLNSFLYSAVPSYLPQPRKGLAESYSEIYSLVFQIFNKILTPKESEIEYITPSTLGVLLCENKVITNNTLWSLCRIYGNEDDGTLENLLKFTYEIMPNLKKDLCNSINCSLEIFEGIGNAIYEDDASNEDVIKKLITLLYDTAFSLNIFMKLYPAYKSICIKENLHSSIVQVYDTEIPNLYNLVKQIYLRDNHAAFSLIDNARMEFIEIWHNLLSYCLDMILKAMDDQIQWVEKYFALVKNILKSTLFLTDFNRCFPIIQDIEMVMAVCPNTNTSEHNELISKIRTNEVDAETALLLEQENQEDIEEEEDELVEDDEEIENSINDVDETVQVEQPEEVVNVFDDEHFKFEEAIALPNEQEMNSKIQELMEMFPTYGDGFLEHCLLSMNMNCQEVIMAILDENLPPHLIELDRTMPRIPPEEPEPVPVFKAAYVGKKPFEYKNVSELLNDKSDMKEHVNKLRDHWSKYDDFMYNDDYFEEDVDHGFSFDVDDPEDVFNTRRKRGVKNLSDDENETNNVTTSKGAKPSNKGENPNRKKPTKSESESDENDAEEVDSKGNGSQQANKMNFCEDPAVIRARREQRYHQKMASKGHKGGNTSNNNNNNTRDVIGNAKGQGQEKEVKHNRDKKNSNKSSRANHNRRSGAQWKRSRGMIPS